MTGKGVDSHFLYPAALFASKEPYLINTILGSCVAVCLHDPKLKVGGMCHYMLPLWNGNGLASPKYGNIAIERLLDKLKSFGATNGSIKAKIFGGGEVIETTMPQFHIGKRNIELAREMLDDLKIPIVASSVGGKLGRKIIFNTETGEVKQRYVKKTIHEKK